MRYLLLSVFKTHDPDLRGAAFAVVLRHRCARTVRASSDRIIHHRAMRFPVEPLRLGAILGRPFGPARTGTCSKRRAPARQFSSWF